MDFTGYRKSASTSPTLIVMFDFARPTDRRSAVCGHVPSTHVNTSEEFDSTTLYISLVTSS